MSSTAKGNHNSPNIYTQENQVISTSPISVGATTLGLVGETLMGPAFQPISISNYKEFQTYFGGCSPEKYANGYPKYELPYIAKSYLDESSQLYVTRVLGLSGYEFKGQWSIGIKNGVKNTAFATIRSKCSYTGTGDTIQNLVTGITITGLNNVTQINDNFTITALYNNGSDSYNVSLNPASSNNILKVIGNSYNANSKNKIFIEEYFESVVYDNLKEGSEVFMDGVTLSASTMTNRFDNYKGSFSYAETPWFVSEVKGNKIIPLFRFITLTDGEAANNMYKISIKNIDTVKLKFDVQIRAIYDTDSNPVVLESYNGCTLDPMDGNDYIGAKIGTVDEQYINKSKYVLIDINDDDDVKYSVPMGFEGYKVKKDLVFIDTPKLSYNTTVLTDGTSSSKKPYYGISDTTKVKGKKIGVDSNFFTYKGNDNTNLELSNGFHMENIATGITYTNNGFDCSFDVLNGVDFNEFVVKDIKLMKFTAYFAGGFDGWDIWRSNRTNTDDFQYYRYTSTPGQSDNNAFELFTFENGLNSKFGIPDVQTSKGFTSDFYAWLSAARSFADPEIVDINVFATPGIDWLNNSLLINEIIDMIENERKDSIYILTTPDKTINKSDIKKDMISPAQIVEELVSSNIDSNYTATYYPWCQYYDIENGAYLYLPPTKDVVANIAYTDGTAYSWFPPAGIRRGTVKCIKAKKSLVLEEEDVLCAGRINIIKTFAKEGVKIWSQRTLQLEDGPLNRVGVRRMMLFLRKSVRYSNLPLIFEPNDNTTKTKFLEIVNPILNSVKNNRGISEYKIEIDDSAEAKIRHELNVKIWVKPISSLEFINIDFMITDEGFDFSTLK